MSGGGGRVWRVKQGRFVIIAFVFVVQYFGGSQNTQMLGKQPQIRTRRIGANPEKSDLLNFRGPD